MVEQVEMVSQLELQVLEPEQEVAVALWPSSHRLPHLSEL
jgi:hypothetical protein